MVWRNGMDVFAFIALARITAGATLQELQHGTNTVEEAKAFYRQDLGLAILLSLFPLTWFIIFFLSGFYERGINFKGRS